MCCPQGLNKQHTIKKKSEKGGMTYSINKTYIRGKDAKNLD